MLIFRRRSPQFLAPALLAEYEPHLARRSQSLRRVGPEGRARLVELERAEAVPPDETISKPIPTSRRASSVTPVLS